MSSLPAEDAATVSMGSTDPSGGVVDLTDQQPAGQGKLADQPDKLLNVWQLGHAQKCVVGGKSGWKCPWCDNMYFPQHATRVLWHLMKGEQEFILCACLRQRCK